jgi:hypothetical protein
MKDLHSGFRKQPIIIDNHHWENQSDNTYSDMAGGLRP